MDETYQRGLSDDNVDMDQMIRRLQEDATFSEKKSTIEKQLQGGQPVLFLGRKPIDEHESQRNLCLAPWPQRLLGAIRRKIAVAFPLKTGQSSKKGQDNP